MKGTLATPAYPWRREQTLILAALLLLASAAWGAMIWQPTATMAHPMGGLTTGMSAPVFLATWVLMMVAMMFPATLPMVLIFHRVANDRRQKGVAAVPTWVFVAGYLTVWAGFGVAFYGIEAVVQGEHMQWLLGDIPLLDTYPWVWVAEDDYERAKALIEEASASAQPLGDSSVSNRSGRVGGF